MSVSKIGVPLTISLFCLMSPYEITRVLPLKYPVAFIFDNPDRFEGSTVVSINSKQA